MLIIFVDAELIKNGTSYLVSDNKLTGTSLEVLSFVVGGIQQNQTFNDGIDGRSRLFSGSEDKFRRITLNVKAEAYDIHDISHLRNAINELFDGEFYIREKRIKTVNVEYESPGQKTGELNFGKPEYVNGQQHKVVKVNAIDHEELLTNEFVIELETTDLPYGESVYTTKELNDTGLNALAEKYGLVDGIDDEQTQYTFYGEPYNENLLGDSDKSYSNAKSNIANYPIKEDLKVGEKVTVSIYGELGDGRISFALYNTSAGSDDYLVGRVSLEDFDDELGAYVGTFSWSVGANSELRVYQQPGSASSSSTITKIKLERGGNVTPFENSGNTKTSFSVFNAGNVTVEPESMYIYITLGLVTTDGSLRLSNKTTGETFAFNKPVSNRNIYLDGMNIMEGTAINALRNTNRQRIKLVPGVNNFEITGATFSQITVSFKFYYK